MAGPHHHLLPPPLKFLNQPVTPPLCPPPPLLLPSPPLLLRSLPLDLRLSFCGRCGAGACEWWLGETKFLGSGYRGYPPGTYGCCIPGCVKAPGIGGGLLAALPGPELGDGGVSGPVLVLFGRTKGFGIFRGVSPGARGALASWGPSFGMMPCRQCGQVSCSFSHAPTHSPWNQCLQGRTVTSSPISTASIHTEHSAFPSCPIIFLSAGFFGNAAMAAAEAGPGALLVFVCSIICVIIRSRASSEKTASPWAPFPSI